MGSGHVSLPSFEGLPALPQEDEGLIGRRTECEALDQLLGSVRAGESRVLVVHGALAGGRISDPAARDADAVTIRETVKAVRESEDWIPGLLPTGEGLLVAVKR